MGRRAYAITKFKVWPLDEQTIGAATKAVVPADFSPAGDEASAETPDRHVVPSGVDLAHLFTGFPVFPLGLLCWFYYAISPACSRPERSDHSLPTMVGRPMWS